MGLCAIGTAFLVLDTLEDSARLGRFHVDPRWLAIFVITFVPFLVVFVAQEIGSGLTRIAMIANIMSAP